MPAHVSADSAIAHFFKTKAISPVSAVSVTAVCGATGISGWNKKIAVKVASIDTLFCSKYFVTVAAGTLQQWRMRNSTLTLLQLVCVYPSIKQYLEGSPGAVAVWPSKFIPVILI